MPNICFLLGNFQNNGGIGRVTSVISAELSKKTDFNVTTISYFQTEEKLLYELPDEIKQYSLYSSQISMVNAMLKYKAVKRVRDIIIKENVDILIACGALFYPLALFSVKGTSAKCICWEHTNPSATTDYNFQAAARKLAVKMADSVVVLTKSAERFYTEKLKIKKEKLVQIYNPVSKDVAKSFEYDRASTRIISVGRLSYPKNFGLLIDIAAKILPQYPQWCWDIFGEGDERESLEKKIHENGLEGKVVLKGQVNNLYERYREYAFQVMTSRYEGFPMSLIEGAANRLPLVSFDIETGPNEIINDAQNGFLIENGNTEQMVDRISELIISADLRVELSKGAYASVRSFDIDKIIERWCELCRGVK